MLDALSELFYNPWIFWGVPLLIAVLLEFLARWRARNRRIPK